MVEFPNANVLSRASLGEIKHIISSLGLLNRASRLRSTARQLVRLYGGEVPHSERELMRLSGVGRYTTNAILCFAFDRDVPIVDTNVARVMKRVFSVRVGKEPHKNKKLWSLMSQVLPFGRARDFNLSLLDHAHKVCKPRNPLCGVCPVNDHCDYYNKAKSL